MAVVDLETTGLDAAGDKIVEISIVHLKPNKEPEVVLNTLVNPMCPVRGTSIHGITDLDVRNAPTFPDILGNVLKGLENCVVASYNIYFDHKFLTSHLNQSGIPFDVPHLCLMYMRPLLAIGDRGTLASVAKEYGIQIENAHRAVDDALVAAKLWNIYKSEFERQDLTIFDDIRKKKKYKFLESFNFDLPEFKKSTEIQYSTTLRARETAPNEYQANLNDYWKYLREAIKDFDIDNWEIEYLSKLIKQYEIDTHSLAFLHSMAYANVLAYMNKDGELSDGDISNLKNISQSLRKLGYCPGD